MTEFVDKPTGANENVDNLDWGNAATQGVDFIEPDQTKRDNAFALDEVVTYPFLNWLFRLPILAILWIMSWKIRAFSDLQSGIAKLAVETSGAEGHIFMLGKSTGFEAPFSTVWDLAGDKTPLAILAMATDGEFIYYGQGNFLIRADRDGTKIAERDLGATVQAITADGFAVVAGTVVQAGSELYNVDRLTLADRTLWPQGSPNDIEAIASDGFVIAVTQGADGILYRHTGAPFIGTLTHGATVRAVAMDWKYAYVAGDVSGGFQVRAYNKTTAATVWSVGIQNTGGAPLIFCMVSDGERLFITSGTVNHGGNQSNIRCFRIKDGVRLWRILTPNGNAPSACTVDECYLYANDGTGQGYVFDKVTGDCLHEYLHNAEQHGIAVDGDALFMGGVESGGVGMIRYSRGNGTKMYIKADGADTNRRPFFNLAIPEDY